MPKLETLWCNYCRIDNLAVFMESLSGTHPQLRHLSLLGNAAAPSYLNGALYPCDLHNHPCSSPHAGGTVAQYSDFRMYAISRLPQLRSLDGSAVADAEREAAVKAYGAVRLTVKSLVGWLVASLRTPTVGQGPVRGK